MKIEATKKAIIKDYLIEWKTLELTEGYRYMRHKVWDLAGPRSKDLRQEFMYILTGKKLPKAKCGVTAIEMELAGKTLEQVQGL